MEAGYGNYGGYGNPMDTYNSRMAQLQQSYPQYFQQNGQMNGYNNMNQTQYQPQQNQYQQQPQQMPQSMQNQQPTQNNQQMNNQSVQQNNMQGYIRGAMVKSAEDTITMFAPPDGSLIVFPTESRKYIYAKALDLNGNSPLLTYVLDEAPPPPPEKPKEFVEKSEISALYERIDNLQKELNEVKSKGVAVNESTNSNGKPKYKSESNDTTTNSKQSSN